MNIKKVYKFINTTAGLVETSSATIAAAQKP
jgi:hypothetical protein